MKVFFNNHFYDAPEGTTPMEFCANCTICHDTCSGCPWNIADMSKAVEITDNSVKEEDCDNYVSLPKTGHFYYSRNLEDNYIYDGSAVCDSLVYCEGTPISDYHTAGISVRDYAIGIKDKLAEMKVSCHDMFYIPEYEGDEAYCLFEYIGEKLGTGFIYNNAHFDKEIPEDVWNKCIKILQEFNKKSLEIVDACKMPVTDNNYVKGHCYFKVNPDSSLDQNIMKSIGLLSTDVKKDNFTGYMYGECKIFDHYTISREKSNSYTQVFFDENWKYEITKDAVNEISDLKNEADKQMYALVLPYIK